MEIRYNILGIEDFDSNEDSGMARIEVFFSSISEEEKEVLNSCGVEYKIINDKRIKISSEKFINFFIEIDGKSQGIFLEKTKEYYKYFKENYSYEENINNKNLIISKEGIKIELIFLCYERGIFK